MKILKKITRQPGPAGSPLDALPGIPVDAGGYAILEDPRLFRERLLALIGGATTRVCICALYWQNDETGREVMDALRAAMRRNPDLAVRVFVDYHRARRGLIGKSGQAVNSDWYRELAADGGVRAPVFGVPVKTREVFGVFHLKGFVIDDTVLYSGASINNVYLHRGDRYRIDRYHEIRSRELADAMYGYCLGVLGRDRAVRDFAAGDLPGGKEFRQEIRKNRRGLSGAAYRFAGGVPGAGQVTVTPLAGLGKKNNLLNETVIDLIESAREELTVFTPYFNFPGRILKAINRALKRGVRVTVTAGDKTANDFYIREGEEYNKIGAVPYIYEMNLAAFTAAHQQEIGEGLLTVRLWKDGLNTFHVKGLSADGRRHLITGNNLNPRAWGLDLENGLLVRDPDRLLLDKIVHERNRLYEHTATLTGPDQLQSLADYPEEYRKVIVKIKKFGAQWLLRKLL